MKVNLTLMADCVGLILRSLAVAVTICSIFSLAFGHICIHMWRISVAEIRISTSDSVLLRLSLMELVLIFVNMH